MLSPNHFVPICGSLWPTDCHLRQANSPISFFLLPLPFIAATSITLPLDFSMSSEIAWSFCPYFSFSRNYPDFPHPNSPFIFLSHFVIFDHCKFHFDPCKFHFDPNFGTHGRLIALFSKNPTLFHSFVTYERLIAISFYFSVKWPFPRIFEFDQGEIRIWYISGSEISFCPL